MPIFRLLPHGCSAARAFRIKYCGLLLILLLPLASYAQTPDVAGPLLTPEQFLGYKLGAQFTPHAELLRYVAHVTAHTPGRMKLVRYGSTYEKRPLEVVQVASAETFGRLEDVRHNNLKLAGLESGTGQRQQPAVCWLSYNVHGNTKPCRRKP